MQSHTLENTDWVRIRTREEFCRLFAGRTLVSGDLEFTIHEDGHMSGSLVEDSVSLKLRGTWTWQEEYFCRTASLDNEDLGTDCEIIETDGTRMRYWRDKGAGESSIAVPMPDTPGPFPRQNR